MALKYVQNDTSPSIDFTVTRAGSAVDLTGATVKFKIKRDDTASRTNDSNNTCTLTSATGGLCNYAFTSGDLPAATTYSCDLEITHASGKVETRPQVVQIKARAES